MRVSTAGTFQRNIDLLQYQKSRDDAALERVSNNQRVNRPSDDPQAMARVIELSQTQERSAQYGASRSAATSALTLQESALGDLTDTLQSARDLLVQAGNGSLGSASISSLGDQLSSLVERMQDSLRTRDADGYYVFSGQQGDQDPLANDANANGNAAARTYRVDDGLTIAGPANRNQLLSVGGTDLLSRLDAMATGLKSGSTNGLGSDALAFVDAGIDNVLGVRAQGGSRLNQLEQLNDLSADRAVAINDQIGELSGTRTNDLTQSISEATMTKLGLEVAMKSISQTQQLSMFDLLNR